MSEVFLPRALVTGVCLKFSATLSKDLLAALTGVPVAWHEHGPSFLCSLLYQPPYDHFNRVCVFIYNIFVFTP
jgi:hypothetical protein